MNDPKKTRAIGLIKTMQDMIDRPSTTEGERAAAKTRIEVLRKKHGLVETAKPTTTTGKHTVFYPNVDYDEWIRVSDMARRQAAAAGTKKAAADRAAAAAASAAAHTRVAQDEARKRIAQERWEQKMRDRDDRGQPLTEAEKAEARLDPLGWAAKQDKRTASERNADIKYRWSNASFPDQQRTNQQARYQARKNTEDYARQARETDERIKQAKPMWATDVKYAARIRNATIQTSKAGNEMVVLHFEASGSGFKGYYVLNNERGLKNLMDIVTTLLGPAATQMALQTILDTLVGKSCRMMLQVWTTDDGEEKFSVQTVLKPWA